MTSDNQEDEFTEVTCKPKKRKATGSPTLPTLQKTGSSEPPPETPTRPKPASIKNKIPVILSGIKEEHKNWRKLLGELRQFHPSLKISQIKELPKGDFWLERWNLASLCEQHRGCGVVKTILLTLWARLKLASEHLGGKIREINRAAIVQAVVIFFRVLRLEWPGEMP